MQRDGSEHGEGYGNGTDTSALSARRLELEDRLEGLEAERRQAEQEGDQVAEAAVLRRMGDLQRAAGMGEDARETYSRARYLYQLTGNAEGAAHLLVTLGNMEVRHSHSEAAARHFREARDLFQRLVVPEREAEAALSEGDAQFALGDNEGALSCYNAAADIFANLEDSLGQAHTVFRLAVLTAADDAEAAAEHFLVAADLFAENVKNGAEGTNAPLPNRITDSRRYPPVLMQKVCERERGLLTGDSVGPEEVPEVSRAEAAKERKVIAAAEPTAATPGAGHNSSWTMWVGVAILLVGTMVLVLPQFFSGSTLLPSLAEAMGKVVSGGWLLQVTMALLGAVAAVLAARQIGINAPVILLALGIGVGAIFHEVGRTLVASVGNSSAAEEAARESVQIEAEAVQVTRTAARKWLADARQALAGNDIESARKALDESHNLFQHLNDKAGQLLVLEERMKLETAHGSVAHRLAVAESLYAAVRGSDRVKERELLEEMVALAASSDSVEKLRSAHQRLLEYHASSGDRKAEVATLLAMAAIARDNQDWEEAYQLLERSNKTYQSLRDNAGQVGTLLAMGEIDSRLGRQRRAYGHYYHAFAMYRELEDIDGQAVALLHMGAIDEVSKRFEEAAAAFRQAKGLYATLGKEEGEALASLRYADVQSEHGNQRQAREAFRRSLDLYTKRGDLAGQAHAHLGLGVLARKQKKQVAAENHYASAEDLYRQANHQTGRLAALRERALMAHASGRAGVAGSQLEEVSRVAKDTADPKERARLLLSVGDLAVSLQRSESAAKTYREAMLLYEDIGDEDGRRAANQRLQRLHSAS